MTLAVGGMLKTNTTTNKSHLGSLISAYVIRTGHAKLHCYSLCLSVWEQAGLNFTWSQTLQTCVLASRPIYEPVVEFIKPSSCSTQLSMKFILNKYNFWDLQSKKNLIQHFRFYEQLKFMLSWVEHQKTFISTRSVLFTLASIEGSASLHIQDSSPSQLWWYTALNFIVSWLCRLSFNLSCSIISTRPCQGWNYIWWIN